MIGLVMAGGKGTRMGLSEEKLLLKYKKPVIFHVIDALNNSGCFSKIMVATSPNSPNTVQVLEQKGIKTLGTPGKGYSSDLNFLLQNMDLISNSLSSRFLFVVSGDLPLLDEKIIQVMIEKFSQENVWTSFLTSKKFLNSLGLESELVITHDNIECVYTGISIIDAWKIKKFNSIKENYVILNDKRIAFNLNTKEDYELLNTT
jgi:adenosylcobinamide-phosphate guanylyltransferase